MKGGLREKGKGRRIQGSGGAASGGVAVANEPLTVKEAASRLKVHPQTVRRWIRQGLLRASKVRANRWGIRESDLASHVRPTPAELARRAAAVDALLAIREQLRGCGVTVRELMEESRRELERRHEGGRG